MGETEAGRTTPGGAQQFGEAMQEVVRGQERSLQLTKGWWDGALAALENQADSYAVMLQAMESSFTAVEKALSSQAEANRALVESLNASRAMIARAAATQEQNVKVVEGLFAGALETLKMQSETLRAQVHGGQALLGASAPGQSEALQRVSQGWLDAYSGMLESSLSVFSRVSKVDPGASDRG